MILGFHCIFGAYGFWLPNEPRGSWSRFVASWQLHRFGPATTVNTRRSVAHQPHDPRLKRRMQAQLKHPPVRLTGHQALAIAAAFARSPYTLHALAILPEHIHLVIAHTDRDIRRVVGQLKSEATRELRSRGWFLDHPPWAQHGWNVYLNDDTDMRRAIAYVARNPTREGLRPQRWSCVTPYDPTQSRAAAARRKRRG